MTLGQRIAQKRKELGLSQESLGEQLGVSRQAIYKWESDASLPEIEKLIALSRLFSVTVGWLLGVEEESQPAGEEELTPRQLAMVREITEGYLSALPAGLSPKRKKQLLTVGAVVGSCMACVLLALAVQLSQITHKYDLLQQSVSNVNWNVQEQINSITRQVEDVLKEQYALTSDWSCDYLSTDPASGTAVFQVRVVPKHYTQGTTALFLAQGDGKTLETSAELGSDHTFSARVEAPLSNEITLSVVFLTGEERTAQQLDTFHDLYDRSFPVLAVHRTFLPHIRDGLLPAGKDRLYYSLLDNYYANQTGYLSVPEEDLSLQLGLFQDGELLVWYQEEYREMTTVSGQVYMERGWFAPRDISLEPGHEYYEAILLTDPWGRQRLYPGNVYTYDAEEGCWTWDASYRAPGPFPTGLDYPLSSEKE